MEDNDHGQPEATNRSNEGFMLHFGYIFFLVLPGILMLLFLGWRWLWLLLPWCAALWLLFFLLDLWEGRWRMVAPEDTSRGAPDCCPQCRNELDIYRRSDRYTVRCPVCNFKGKGTFSSG